MPIEPSEILQQYLRQCRQTFLLDPTYTDPRIFRKYYPLILKQARKWLAGKLDPFRLCPNNVTFWFFVRPYSAIGLTIGNLQNVQVFWRQQMEPNETVYLLFKLFELTPPFSLTLLAAFASLALVIVDASYRIFEALGGQYEAKLQEIEQEISELSDEPVDIEKSIIQEETLEKHRFLLRLLDPFSLTPRMSIYFPVLDQHTSLGFLTIDFSHVELSAKQSLEPSGNIVSLIRFLDLYSPFPLQIAVMILAFGLFISGAVYKFEKEKREEILQDVKEHLNSSRQYESFK